MSSKRGQKMSPKSNIAQQLKQARLELATVKRTTGVRSQMSSAPPAGNHVLFLYVGQGVELATIHTNLLPKTTQEHIHSIGYRWGFFVLPDEEVETFRLYRTYCYTGKICSQAAGDQDAEGDAEWHRLMLLYFMGARLKDERFCNRIIDALVEKVAEAKEYPTGMAAEIWAHVDVDDKLRILYVDLHVWMGQGTGVRAPHEDAKGPYAFLHGVRRALAMAGKKVKDLDIIPSWVKEETRCLKYHSHRNTDPCCAEVVDLTAIDG